MSIKTQLRIKNNTQVPHLLRREDRTVIHCQFDCTVLHLLSEAGVPINTISVLE